MSGGQKMNMNERVRERALKQLSAYDFAQLELNLFLDTHPCNQKALNEFHRINQKAKELRRCYEEEFGALTTSEVSCQDEWAWINSPWPWEN